MAKKLVHWALETLGSPSLPSLKLPGHPEDESMTDSSEESDTATLQYVNSQLLAHGFMHNSGISLEGTSKEDSEKVLKCLVSMLGQRMEDMSRTEELATKIRTLSYDHERLQSLYRTATETAANAEREMNVHKARLASSTRTLATTSSSLKASQAELQRTRTALQSVRAAHQAELKKVEKDKDKLLEKVAKLSEHQYATRVAGIRYANENAVSQYGASSLGPTPAGASSSTSGGQVLGGVGDFLEVTLEESMRHRQELADENRALKGLLLRVANDIQHVDFQARSAAADLLIVKKDTGRQDGVEEPDLLASVTLFPLSPPGPTTASTTISSLLISLQDSLRTLADPEGRIITEDGLTATSLRTARRSTTEVKDSADFNGFAMLTKQMGSKDKEREQERAQHQANARKLNSEIERLRSELEQAQTQASTLAAQIQLKDISKQVEAMQRPWSIYGSQPSEAVPSIPANTDDVQMDIDSAPPAPPPPLPVPKPSNTTTSSKRAISKIFQAEPHTEPSLSSIKPTDGDVFAHLPPPSPALSYLDEPPTRSPAKPVAAPVRRSPRKPKPTSPLRVAAKAGAKRKAETASPEGVKTKKAKTELSKKGVVSESVRGFNAGVAAISSPKVRPQRKAAEKVARPTAPLPRAKGKERAALKSSTATQKSELAAKTSKVTPAVQIEVLQSQKPSTLPPLSKGSTAPSLPTFVLPPPSPASRLPSIQIPSEAGPSNPKNDGNPFLDSAQHQSSAAAPAIASSTNPAPQQASQPPSSSAPSVPQTPSRRIFPSGRPMVSHMVHAYSPVKPSPLSRVLMLADSPDSPEAPPIPRLGALVEVEELEDEDGDGDGEMDAPLSPTPARRTRRLSLAEELGVSDDDAMDEDDEMSDSDEVESLVRGQGKGRAAAKPSTRAHALPSSRARRGRVSEPKGKGRAKAKAASPAKPAVGKAKEKENRRRSTRTKASPTVKTRSSASGSANAKSAAGSAKGAAGDVKKTRAAAKASTSRAKTATLDAVPPLELEDLEPAGTAPLKLKGKSRGGPRRVPIESVDAAPVPVWRG